jgi:hypothetical protein
MWYGSSQALPPDLSKCRTPVRLKGLQLQLSEARIYGRTSIRFRTIYTFATG